MAKGVIYIMSTVIDGVVNIGISDQFKSIRRFSMRFTLRCPSTGKTAKFTRL
ncbi:Uncharacterised protein [Taylorella equigenitalis ATCC 35865]|nr:Uncharacterised protein [Taylorella equigenitalis ATCC 35865]